MTTPTEHDNQENTGALPSKEGQPAASESVTAADTSIPVDDTSLDEQLQSASDSAPVAPKAPVIEPAFAVVKEIPLDEEADPNAAPKDHPERYTGVQWPQGNNPNVGTVDPIFHPLSEAQKNDPFFVASIPCDAETFNSLLEAYPSINYNVGQPNREWANVISTGARMLMQGGFLSKAVSRDDSKWVQRVPYGASDLGIIRPRLNSNSGPGVQISGDLASLRVRQSLGLGGATNVPLWHSGFWVTLRAPSTAARLELQQRIDQEKIELGRSTAGLAFSNISIYLKSYLVDFALAHLSTANVRYTTPLELKDKILSTDIPILIWGLLTTLYPHGYAYHQPCINDPSKCQHVVKEILDLNKIAFTDMQRLTQSQLKHMANRQERKEDIAIENYRSEHNYTSRGLIEVSTLYGKVKMQLKVPTITEYAAAGFDWVDGIVNAIQQAFGSTLQGEARNAFIMDRAKTLSMGEYSHWIKEIGFDDGTTITDLDTLRMTLAEISGDPDLSASFFTKVTSYIEDCTMSLIALPRFNCPVCGTPTVSEEEKKHPYLNPIDVEALFFTMLGQHIAKALS